MKKPRFKLRKKTKHFIKRILVLSLMLFIVCISLSAQKTPKNVKQKALTYEEINFMHKIDYDFRHPDKEERVWQFQDIFSNSQNSLDLQTTRCRLANGLKDTSNLIDLVSCYQKMIGKTGFSDIKDPDFQLMLVRSYLHVYLPSLEPEELDYLLMLSNNKLHALANTYAQYLKKNKFPPR